MVCGTELGHGDNKSLSKSSSIGRASGFQPEC